MSRMDILSPRQYMKDGEVKTHFVKIGTAWPMQGRDGYSLTFDALPVPSLSDKGAIETRVVMMPPKPRDDDRGGGAADRDAPF